MHGSAIVALATACTACGVMKSSWALLVLFLVLGGKTGIASNTVNPTGVREPVRYLPPLMEMARCRFRGLAFGKGERVDSDELCGSPNPSPRRTT